MRKIIQLLLIIVFNASFANILNGQKILGINLNANPEELTGYDIEYFVGLEKHLVDGMGNQVKFIPVIEFKNGHLSQTTIDYLQDFGLTELKISYPLGLASTPQYKRMSLFNRMRPDQFHLHTSSEINHNTSTLFRRFFKLKRQIVKELGAPEFEQSDEKMNFLRWLGLDYQIILSFDKDKQSIWLSYFPK
jgi:hypothetical protein